MELSLLLWQLSELHGSFGCRADGSRPLEEDGLRGALSQLSFAASGVTSVLFDRNQTFYILDYLGRFICAAGSRLQHYTSQEKIYYLPA